MADQAQRAGIELGFNQKRKTYCSSNYGTETSQNSLRRERRDQINQWIEQVEDKRHVLDIGCGPALLYPKARTECETYYAMDIVQSNLDEFFENNP